jgi:NAD(P)-dependent dehydrogenase (short-subunit alcohol dehydrogenase family)
LPWSPAATRGSASRSRGLAAGGAGFAYNASKTALNAFTVLLAKELAPEGFKMNVINPGFTATDMNGHTGTRAAADAAGTVLRWALISPDGPTGGFFTEGGRVPW